MAKRTRQLTFAEFGRQFIERAISPESIGHSLEQMVPREQQLVLAAPTRVVVQARTELGAAERLPTAAPDRELAFAVPVRAHLELAVDLIIGQERYMALATARLCLSARTLAPLTIQIDCDPVAPEEISVASEGNGNWFDLTKRLGVLDSAIQQQVADMINQHIQRSHHLRTIDVRKLIATSADQIAGAASQISSAGRRKRKQAKLVL